MATPQYVYVMNRLSKTYPGGKQVLKDVTLAFLPGAKIGVLGLNGAGKSTLLRIMAGQETEFVGEAWAADGVSVGYLPQEPVLDDKKDVTGNVMEGVAEKKAKLDRYNELAVNYSDETAEEMARLQDEIDAQGHDCRGAKVREREGEDRDGEGRQDEGAAVPLHAAVHRASPIRRAFVPVGGGGCRCPLPTARPRGAALPGRWWAAPIAPRSGLAPLNQYACRVVVYGTTPYEKRQAPMPGRLCPN